MDNPLLRIENINVKYGSVKALDGVSLHIDEGEIVALMGPNGAGKSTLLKVIFGLIPYTGDVVLRGKTVVLSPHELLACGISFVPQGRRVFPHLTVLENIEMGGKAMDSRDVLREKVEDLFELFPMLKEKRHQKAGQLSGGQQQMVALARGLMSSPKLLLLDEPSLGLAPKVVKEIFAKIEEINKTRKTAVLVVEHNIKSLVDIADRACVLDKGKVVQEGPADSVDQHHIIENVYFAKE